SYRICYYSKDVVLKNFTNSLLFKLSRYVPHVITTKRKVYAVRLSDKNLASELLKLSPSYKTNPRHYQSKSSYLSEIQPSIKFIKSANAATQKWCIRFALSTDGCISMSRRGIAELNLACCNPKLVEEWLELFEEYGINGNIGRNKSYWGGISGIRIYDPQSIKNFYKIGGFVPEVLISSKSKRYKGLEKNRLLLQAIVGS
ncbi:MAG: hypothetical protein KGH98_05030, partial [Candidatus Micrarchaeota archaeon]|nr:hypothetical protein [Candidatus Micrarchaeota archaeon]